MVQLGFAQAVGQCGGRFIQGGEGGGHTGAVPTTVLLPQVLDAVGVPVVAAGGFHSGRGLAGALAFGAAGGFGESVPVDEARSVIEALVGDSKRVELNWALSADRLPKGAVKVLLNFAQIAVDALVRGGTLVVGAERRWHGMQHPLYGFMVETWHPDLQLLAEPAPAPVALPLAA